MAAKVQFDLCPETGAGCVTIHDNSGVTVIDLLPQDVAHLKIHLKVRDMEGARSLLVLADAQSEFVVDLPVLEALAKELE